MNEWILVGAVLGGMFLFGGGWGLARSIVIERKREDD